MELEKFNIKNNSDQSNQKEKTEEKPIDFSEIDFVINYCEHPMGEEKNPSFAFLLMEIKKDLNLYKAVTEQLTDNGLNWQMLLHVPNYHDSASIRELSHLYARHNKIEREISTHSDQLKKEHLVNAREEAKNFALTLKEELSQSVN